MPSRISISQLQNASRSIEALRQLFPEVSPPALPPVPPPDISDLTHMQKIALMQMWESHAARAVIAALKAEVQDKPSFLDYRALADRGWCEHRRADGWHHLIGYGLEAARLLERKLCVEYGLHLTRESGGDRFNVGVSCSCGWHTNVRKGRSTQSGISQAIGRHLRSANGLAGIVKAVKAGS